MKSASRSLILLGAFIATTEAGAGTVKELNAKKGTVVVEPADGESFSKGAEVCAFSDSGKKIDCGKVTAVKDDGVTVKFKSKKKFKRIKEGFEIKSSESAEGLAEGEEAAAGKKGKKGAASKSSAAPFRIYGLWMPAIVGPTQFNKLAYQAGDAAPAAPPTTIWNGDKPSSTALATFGLQFGIPLSSMSLVPGFRYRIFTPSLIDSDYTKSAANPYVTTEQKGSAIGLFFDLQFLRSMISPSFAFDLAGGLDIEKSSISITSTKKTDNAASFPVDNPNLASAKSELTVISLRMGTGFDWMFTKAFGARFGMVLLVPLAETGGTFSATIPETEKQGVTDLKKDMQTKLGHKKNSFGAELNLGLTLAF